MDAAIPGWIDLPEEETPRAQDLETHVCYEEVDEKPAELLGFS